MFIAAVVTIAKTWKQSKCPSTKGWIKKMYIHTMEYYSAIKSNKIGSSAVMRLNLESVTENEVNEENKYHILTHIYGN